MKISNLKLSSTEQRKASSNDARSNCSQHIRTIACQIDRKETERTHFRGKETTISVHFSIAIVNDHLTISVKYDMRANFKLKFKYNFHVNFIRI